MYVCLEGVDQHEAAGSQIFAFLGVATTNVLASHSPLAPGIAEDERLRRTAHGQRMLCYLLTIAVGLGIVVVLVMQARDSRLPRNSNLVPWTWRKSSMWLGGILCKPGLVSTCS